MAALPMTARDVFRLTWRQRLQFDPVIALARATGIWKYPIEASGDLETMQRRDMIYWLYKAQYPVTRAVRGSGLERYFARRHEATLPMGFRVMAELEMSSAGDLMDHRYLERSASSLYADVDDALFGVDISMANLECVVVPGASRDLSIATDAAPELCFGDPSFDAVRGRFSFLTTANNHSLDAGEAGVHSTLAALRQRGVASHGTNETAADAVRATILERNGILVGVISHTFGLNAHDPPPLKPWIVNRTRLNNRLETIDLTSVDQQLASCMSAGVDFVVAHLHWGMEHEYYPRPEQLRVAHRLAESGCDLIIGHHPHVVQPYELYRPTRDVDRLVPIFYSLGNLVNPFSDPRFRLGRIARVRIAKGTRGDGRTRTYVASVGSRDVFQEIDEAARVLRIVPASPAQTRGLPFE